MIALPVFHNSIVVLGPAEKPATGELLNRIMHQVKLQALYSPPTVVEQLLQESGVSRKQHSWTLYCLPVDRSRPPLEIVSLR
jgi:hypothetical protein